MKKLAYYFYDSITFKQLKYVDRFTEMEGWTLEQLKEYQLSLLRANLNIFSWEQFHSLPLTGKGDLPRSPQKKESHYQHETSGSTGEPRVIWVPRSGWHRKDAIFTRSWMRIGRKQHEPVLRLIAGEPKYKTYDYFRNVYPVNYRNINSDTVNFFLKIKPRVIHGPGGAIRQLCEMLIAGGYQSLLKHVLIEWCSESPEGHRERLEPFVEAFHQQYGLAELPTVGSPDGLGNMRVVEEQGVVEIVDDEGNQVPEGHEGFVVITDFHNTLTPIVRYKSGDRAKVRTIRGFKDRTYKIIYDVVGRRVDFYWGPEVKRPIGWSIVSPISHTLGEHIDRWRIEVYPTKRRCRLFVRFKGEKSEFGKLHEYGKWIKQEYGLDCEYDLLETAPYDIHYKNRLVTVVL
jgi:phenylacetate-coenzyme A ligase PaaK-like adenylate-forming protein